MMSIYIRRNEQMKKTISLFCAVILCAVLILAGGCSGKQPQESSQNSNYYLKADKTEVSPGETITVYFHIDKCERAACFDVTMSVSGNASAGESGFKDNGTFYTSSSETEDGVAFGAYVAETADILDADFCYVTYTVSEEAEPGSEVTFSAFAKQFLIGKDASGAQTDDITDTVDIAPLVIKVK